MNPSGIGYLDPSQGAGVDWHLISNGWASDAGRLGISGAYVNGNPTSRAPKSPTWVVLQNFGHNVGNIPKPYTEGDMYRHGAPGRGKRYQRSGQTCYFLAPSAT